jgi:antitoxin component of RelBE/YafQ-DinJ toxin-antitoxin module
MYLEGKRKLNIWIDEGLALKFKAVCKKMHIPMSELIEGWVENYVKKAKSEKAKSK